MTLLDPGRGVGRLGLGLADHGGRLAIAGCSGSLTYSELAARVDEVAARLGPRPRLVLTAMRPTVEHVVGYLGAMSAGHPVLVTEDDPARIAELVDRFDPDVVLHAAGDDVALEERRATGRHVLHPDLALLLPTSGSTGAPRHVRLSHANVLANAAAIGDYLCLTADDRAITSLPLHYCYGLSVLHSHLLQGAGVVLTDRSVVDRCFWDAFREHGVTNLAGVPYTFEMLERIGFADLALPTLRFVTQAGGPLPPDQVVRLAELGRRDGWDLVVMYGQTEATARMAYLPPHLAADHPTSIGVPIPGGTFRLAPIEDGPRDVGELVYSGPNVMLGYASSPAELALGAVVDELRTGDLARRTPDGLYEIVGRRSRFAKVCGLRLDLDHIEARLGDAGIDAMSASDDERIALAVTEPADVERATAIVRDLTGLPPTRVSIVAVAALPRLANGKPDHRKVLELAAPVDEPATVDAGVARDVYRQVLGREVIADSDTFVSLGGDSLSYVEASIRLEALIGELPPDWPSLAVGELVSTAKPSPRVARLETTAVLRAAGIVLIVGMHVKRWGLRGGAHLLLALAGYSFGRFQHTTAGRWRSVARIAVPSALWLALATQLNPRIRWQHVLQVNGWFGDPGAHGGYWFMEALLQILVPLTLLLAVPTVARVARSHPLQLSASALAVGLLVRFHVLDLPVIEPHDIRPHDIFWIFALGWTAAHVTTLGPRLALSLVVVGAVPGYFGEPQREVLIVAGLLLLLWVSSVPVPRALSRPIGLVAGGSLYIYLCHWQVFPPLRTALGPVAALVGSVAAGVLLWLFARRAEQLLGRWVHPGAAVEPDQPALA